MIEDSYHKGDIVYGKIKGFPLWPGRIAELLSKEKYKIRFFGDNSHAVIPKKRIVNFDEYNAKNHKVRNEKLEKAIHEAHLARRKQDNTLSESPSKKKPNEIKATGFTSQILTTPDHKHHLILRGDALPVQFELDELLQLDMEHNPSSVFLKKKTMRDSKDNQMSKERLLHTMVNYLCCLTLQYLKKQRKGINDAEKNCLLQILNYIKDMDHNSISALIQFNQVDVLLLHLIRNISDEDIKKNANETYDAFMSLYLLSIPNQIVINMNLA